MVVQEEKWCNAQCGSKCWSSRALLFSAHTRSCSIRSCDSAKKAQIDRSGRGGPFPDFRHWSAFEVKNLSKKIN